MKNVGHFLRAAKAFDRISVRLHLAIIWILKHHLYSEKLGLRDKDAKLVPNLGAWVPQEDLTLSLMSRTVIKWCVYSYTRSKERHVWFYNVLAILSYSLSGYLNIHQHIRCLRKMLELNQSVKARKHLSGFKLYWHNKCIERLQIPCLHWQCTLLSRGK